MNSRPEPAEEKLALSLSFGEWLIVALLVAVLIAFAPLVHLRDQAPVVEQDYRIPYALSSRYEVYRRFASLSAAQFPVIVIGDSVVWGQCAHREDTLPHHLNELTRQPRFANGGLDGMHPVALVELIEHHAPSISHKDVILQLDPLWFMAADNAAVPGSIASALLNRPGLVPRLAAELTGGFKSALNSGADQLIRNSSLAGLAERLAEFRLDFLAWSLDHPYENPLRAVTSALPPSEDGRHLQLLPWNRSVVTPVESNWAPLQGNLQWRAFERLLTLLEFRSNRVLVLVGPMNEHMMSPGTRARYVAFKEQIRQRLNERGATYFFVPVLGIDSYGDICHPLGSGYEEWAQELLRVESAWLLHTPLGR